MNGWRRRLGSALGERLYTYTAGMRLLMLRPGVAVLVLLRLLLMALLLILRDIGPAQLSLLLTWTCRIAAVVLVLLLLGIGLPFLLRNQTTILSIMLPIAGIGALIYIYDRWRSWYPNQPFGPTVRRYAVRLLRLGAVALAYVEVHHYLNELTGVDPGNFLIALAALTTLYTVAMWLLITPIICIPIGLWHVARYIAARVTTRTGRYRNLSNYWLQELDLAQIGRQRGSLRYLTDTWYRMRNSQAVRSFLGLDLAEKRDLAPLSEKLRVLGVICLYISGLALYGLPSENPSVQRVVRIAASAILIATEFSYDRTCAVSSDNRLVAHLKDRKETTASLVSIADIRSWDISFCTGTCEQMELRCH